MFTLQDGREHLYQWDLDRYIIVEDPNICEVHFCNRTSDCSLVVEVKDGLAAIPNIILQDARPIRAYAYVDDKYTLVEEQFTVKGRTRPADYVYTETEVKRWEDLAAKAENTLADAEAAVASIERVAAEGISSIETKANDALSSIDNVATTAVSTIETVSTEAKQSVETTSSDAINTLNGIVNEANQAINTVNQTIETLEGKVDGLATEDYVDEAVASAGGAYYFDLTNATADWTAAPQSVADAANALLASGVTDTVVYAKAVYGTYDTAAVKLIKAASRIDIHIYTSEKLKVNTDKSATNYTSTFTVQSSSASTGWSYKKAETSNVLATTAYITNKGFATASEVDTLLNSKGYLTQQSLNGYAKTSDIPDVSAFQTEAQVNALINNALGVIENGTY